MQAFEWYLPDDGNYYKNLTKEAKNLKEKGIDALWLAPMFKATGTNDVGYGVYDLYDLGEFDQKGSVRTKYGTVEELKKLIEVLHENDIKVYADVVLKLEQISQKLLRLTKSILATGRKELLMLMILKHGLDLILKVGMENILSSCGISNILMELILIINNKRKQFSKSLEKTKDLARMFPTKKEISII